MPQDDTFHAQDDPFDIDVGEDEDEDDEDLDDEDEEEEEEGGWQVGRLPGSRVPDSPAAGGLTFYG